MTDSDQEFLRRLLATFRVEAKEHVDALFQGILELESKPDAETRASLVEHVFREAHSLKGAARSVDQIAIEGICQSLEDTFAAMKRNELLESPGFYESLQFTLNQLNDLLGESGTAPSSPSQSREMPATDAPAQAPEAILPTPAPAPAPKAAPVEKTATAHTVRIPIAKLDSIFLQVEEMLAAKLLAQQRRQELSSMQMLVAQWNKEWSSFDNFATESPQASLAPAELHTLLDQNATFIKALNQQLNTLVRATEQDQRMIGRMVDELLEDMKKVLMLPFSTVLEVFPRLIRDLARQYGKDIELAIQGGELEADRRILEAIKDPLLHLVRNAIDHGIETPEERMRMGKPGRGKVVIAVQPHNGNRVSITISDDGCGIDTGKVKSHALRLGLLNSEEADALSESEMMDLIYHSGVSTSPIITEISGRGLGLAIVREKIDSMGGSVHVSTHMNIGTSFRILLPLTLATYRGIIVRISDQVFVLPTSHVEQTTRALKSEIFTTQNRTTVRINGTTYSLAYMGDVLGIAHEPDPDTPFVQVVLLAASGRQMAFVVDEVVNEQEVLVKSLGKQLSRVRNVAAATILGSGKAVPILNVLDMIKSAVLAPTSRTAVTAAAVEERASSQKNVLVVEDSITARGLLKGILELAGYKVTTAVDGVDGYTQLRSGNFDIVVSDVEMPRMDGFDLTAKIRADKKFADLPVILVTALESREDRERGIDVGADAYIVKRSFEQSNLLEIIGRLI